MDKKLVVICGPTAVGKTELAFRLVRKFKGQILSADSRQVYKGMTIGTGKDIPSGVSPTESDIRFRNEPIVYYVIAKSRLWGYDLADVHENFSVTDYLRVGRAIITQIDSLGCTPFIVGGTG